MKARTMNNFLKYFYIHLTPYRLYKYFAPKCSSYMIEVYDTAYGGFVETAGHKITKAATVTGQPGEDHA